MVKYAYIDEPASYLGNFEPRLESVSLPSTYSLETIRERRYSERFTSVVPTSVVQMEGKLLFESPERRSKGGVVVFCSRNGVGHIHNLDLRIRPFPFAFVASRQLLGLLGLPLGELTSDGNWKRVVSGLRHETFIGMNMLKVFEAVGR